MDSFKKSSRLKHYCCVRIAASIDEDKDEEDEEWCFRDIEYNRCEENTYIHTYIRTN